MLEAGGDVGTIATGGSRLASAARDVGAQAHGVSSHGSNASSQVGDPVLSAAIGRFQAALGRTVADLEVELRAASTLAVNGAQDLGAATGSH